MALDDLLTAMEQRAADTLDTPAKTLGYRAEPLPIKACTPDTLDTRQNCNRHDEVAKVGAGETAVTAEHTLAADRELLRLWFDHVGGDDPVDFRDLIETCMNNVEAMAYYRKAACNAGIVIDDRRTCGQCANLRGQVCTAAKALGASANYRPMLMVLHPGRCLEYAPGPNDIDRRTGRERWMGLAAMETNTTYRKGWK